MARTPAAEARRKAQQVTSASPRGSMPSRGRRWPRVGDWMAGPVSGLGRPSPAVVAVSVSRTTADMGLRHPRLAGLAGGLARS